MTKLFSILFLLFLGPSILAQKNVYLNIEPVFNGAPLQIGSTLNHSSGESYALDHFDYYVSDVLLTHDGGQISAVEQDVYLVEPESHTLFLGSHDLSTIEQIEFTVGVPDRLNTQEGSEAIDISAYPETHPLSFQSPSMYWGWSFGYMPMIIGGGEGASYFEIHPVGAHLQKQVALAVVQTNTSVSQIDLELECHVDRWVNNVQLLSSGALHGEFPENILVMNNVLSENVFALSPSAELAELNTGMQVLVEEGSIHIHSIPATASKIEIVDQLGRIVLSQEVVQQNHSFDFDRKELGVAFVLCTDASGAKLEKKTIFIP